MTLAEQWQISANASDHYERFAVGRHLRPIAERFLEQLSLRSTDRALDVACGTGIVARLAAEKIGRTGQVTGLDLNVGMLKTAKKLAGDADLPIQWTHGDATALPFSASEFDVVLCQQGLQFIPDKARALREMRRVLVPEGTFAINTFGRASAFHVALAESLAKYVNASVSKLSLAPFALSDPTALQALIETAGFRKVSLRTLEVARRVEPTQQWLLQYSSALPYAESISAMDPAERAEMLRAIASSLKDHWASDSFLVPCEVHFVCASS
jgi:ubiquinone/menaquinone biosynthesis C-methylase UbiE